jgi:hypothetical protein
VKRLSMIGRRGRTQGRRRRKDVALHSYDSDPLMPGVDRSRSPGSWLGLSRVHRPFLSRLHNNGVV